MALSQENRKQLISLEFIRGEAQQTAEDIFRIQRTIALTHVKSGEARRILQQSKYTIAQRNRGISMQLFYPLKLRFMDMKHTARGVLKKNYDPIYNKIVWGHVYGYLYKRLVYGISTQLNQAIVQRLQNAGFKIK